MAAQNTLKAKQVKKYFQLLTVWLSYRCTAYRGIPIFNKRLWPPSGDKPWLDKSHW